MKWLHLPSEFFHVSEAKPLGKSGLLSPGRWKPPSAVSTKVSNNRNLARFGDNKLCFCQNEHEEWRVEIIFAPFPHVHWHHSNKTCSVSKPHGSPRGGIHFRFTLDIEVFQVCNNIGSQGYLHIHPENSRVPRWIFLWTNNADQLRVSLELYYSPFRLSFGRTLSDSNYIIFMLLSFMSKE